MSYPYPEPSFVSVGDLFIYVSQVTDGYLGLFIALSIFIVSYANSLQNGSRKALMVASFITLISSLPLASLGLLAPEAPIYPAVLLGVSLFFLGEEGQ